jgi:hypothetical protein
VPSLKHPLRQCRLLICLVIVVAGCEKSEPVDERLRMLDPANLVPVSGKVTINGKPVATVVITFLPPDGPALGTAETDEEGKYELSSAGGKGVLPGDYKVAISYLVSADGEPQGRAARSSQVQGPGMLSAKEKLPPEYADLGRSKLSATVSAQGGEFNFDVPASIPAVEPKPTEKKKEEDQSKDKAKDAKPADK